MSGVKSRDVGKCLLLLFVAPFYLLHMIGPLQAQGMRQLLSGLQLLQCIPDQRRRSLPGSESVNFLPSVGGQTGGRFLQHPRT